MMIQGACIERQLLVYHTFDKLIAGSFEIYSHMMYIDYKWSLLLCVVIFIQSAFIASFVTYVNNWNEVDDLFRSCSSFIIKFFYCTSD